MRASLFVAFALLVGGCRTTGGKIAGSVTLVGLGVETAGMAKLGQDDDSGKSIMLIGALIATAGLLGCVVAEHRPIENVSFSSGPPSSSSTSVTCRFGNCDTDGWTERRSDGTERTCRCNFADCKKHGWTCD
jgi:hypothetical protein